MGFLDCELRQGGIPQHSQVVYNIILPSGSIESDFFGADKFCVSSPATAWHFHQTPYSPEGATIGGLLLGVAQETFPVTFRRF